MLDRLGWVCPFISFNEESTEILSREGKYAHERFVQTLTPCCHLCNGGLFGFIDGILHTCSGTRQPIHEAGCRSDVLDYV